MAYLDPIMRIKMMTDHKERKMRDRRGYEAEDLRKAAKSVERKGGKAEYDHEMRLENKDYLKDVKKHHDSHGRYYQSGSMGRDSREMRSSDPRPKRR